MKIVSYIRLLYALAGVFLMAGQVACAQNDWWRNYQDARLDTLVSLALQRNGNIVGQSARIRAAQERVEGNRAAYLPNVYVDPLVQQQSLAPNRPLPIATGATQSLQRFTLRTFALPVDVAYDINFWQKKTLVGQAQNLVLQAAATLEQTSLQTVGQVVQAYTTLRGLDLQLAVLRRNARLLDSVNRILSARYKAGLTNEVSVSLNQTERQALLITLENTLRQRQETIADLETYTATVPLMLVEDSSAPFLPIVDTGLGQDVTLERPDVQQYRYQVEGAKLTVRQLDYNRLPRPFVQGSTGFLSRNVGDILSSNSFTYTVGAGVAIPIWDYRNNRYFVRAARRDVEGINALYKQQIISAQADVRAGVSNVVRTSRQIRQNQDAVASARYAIRLTSELYTKGLITFLDLLNAERNLIALETQRAQLQQAYLTYVAAYWLARGGK